MRGTAPSGGIFAPTLRYHEEEKTFYMTTTWFDVISPPDNVTRTPRSFYVKTRNIWDETTWSDPTYVEQPGFDPDLYFEGNKTVLSSTSGAGFVDPDSGYFAVWKTEIDRHTGNSLVESELFHVSTLPLDTPRLAEGSHIYKKDGWYYLLTAEAGTDVVHRAMIKRARSLDGPWTENPNNPILFNGRDPSLPILATGHADFVETPKGDWYMVFLGTRPQAPQNSSGYNQLGRETFLAPVIWDKDGWPVVNGGNPITFEMPGLYDLARPKLWRDDFNGKLKDKGYYTARTPYKTFYSLDARPGYLRVRGNPYTLNDRETPAALFRKQVDLETVWSAELDFQPTNERHEAGATIYLSIHYHNEVALTLRNGTRVLVARTRSGPTAIVQETYVDAPGKGPVQLFIRASRDKYELGYSLNGQAPKYVAEVASRWLQAHLEGWQVFTGAFFGIYSTGALLPILVPADFKYVQTELVRDVS